MHYAQKSHQGDYKLRPEPGKSAATAFSTAEGRFNKKKERKSIRFNKKGKEKHSLSKESGEDNI